MKIGVVLALDIDLFVHNYAKGMSRNLDSSFSGAPTGLFSEIVPGRSR
jgi:hypothetical protein